MHWLPWLIVALVLGGVILYLATGSAIPFVGEGKLDARGEENRDRAPPPDVDPASQLAKQLGAFIGSAMKHAGDWWKPGATKAADASTTSGSNTPTSDDWSDYMHSN